MSTGVYYSGATSALIRTLIPLVSDTAQGMARRILFRSPQPPHAHDVDASLAPSFSSPAELAHYQRGELLSAQHQPVLGTHNLYNPATSYHFSYVTEDARGRKLAATGAAFFSHRTHPFGIRPTIAFAPSTQGVASHCDPSVSCVVGVAGYIKPALDAIVSYEQPVINYFLARGANVVITDYPRDPDLGIQLYCDHQSGAFALWDAVLAAQSLGLNPEAPVGVWGFSQGGGAGAALVEHLSTQSQCSAHAAVIGAPPSRLDEVLSYVDGGLATGVIAYTTAGLLVSSADIRSEILGQLDNSGLKKVLDASTTCSIGVALHYGWQNSSQWTTSHRRLAELLDETPAVKRELEDRRLGKTPPTMPVLLWGSTHDDVVPISQVRELKQLWEKQGARIQWRENSLPRIPGRSCINHFLPYYQHFTSDASWLLDHLSSKTG
ncbi:triacylglycerol lipase [Corynebacterium poyangense]|uniref:Triacylglycerol lipase n=1 Tax=Corynebacterium poyangense TaxID=2684405 RepID=A0A7H0SNT7_9CORY|nr:lipase family protein [Corynebacterium poyangense]QNQ90212.1 triacylglycerol lipase [Corynebacterium poyangense]